MSVTYNIETGELIETPDPKPSQAELDNAAADFVRKQRDTRLQETDWWALSDRTMTPEQAAYRQSLRDITDQYGFPHNIDWPIKPE